MKPNIMNRAWLSLGCTLLGASGLHLYLARYEREVGGGEPKGVVVATRDIALGDVITRAALDTRELPERYVEERHIAFEDLAHVLGARATSAVSSGAALLWSDLDVAQDQGTLAALVRTGMRAFTLPERDVTFDGLLRPGDRVDVLFTPAEGSEPTSTLLQSALVLTVGRDLGRAGGAAASLAERAARVTLSVSPVQAQRLASAERRGSLRLALRNPQDFVISPSTATQPSSQDAAQHERALP
jgi:pilus assembly protein CpaB